MYIPKYMYHLIKIVFNISIIQRRGRREEREQQQQQADQYNMVHLWKAQERERDAYPHPITTTTQGLLREVGLLKFYE